MDNLEPCNAVWPQPIPVSERLPESDTHVLAYGNDGNPLHAQLWDIALYEAGAWPWLSLGRDLLTVTHWLPLPPAPEVKND